MKDKITSEIYDAYCAPVNLIRLKDSKGASFFEKFFVNTVSRAVLGTRRWKTSEKLVQASVSEKITKEFPPTFITDGNAFSFQEQGMEMERKLKSLNIPVESLFYADSNREVPQEYQFNYQTAEAKECLSKTNDFIKKVLKGF